MSTATPTSKFLDRCEAGDVAEHPYYGRVRVVRNVRRGALTNVAGFPPGVYVEILTGERAGQEIPVYGGTRVIA